MQLQKIHFATKTPDDDPIWDLLSDLDNALGTAVKFL